MSNIIVTAAFTKNTGEPATGLTLAEIDLYLTRQTTSSGADEVVWDGTQNPTEEIDNIGAYTRIYTGADFDVYTYYARASYTGATSLDTDHVTGIAGKLTCTLTQTGAEVAATLSGDDLTIRRGDSLSVVLTGLGDISGRTKLWFTAKEEASTPDTAAAFQIEETAGLLYINGDSAGTSGNGVITVDDEAAGDITVTLDEAETAKLRPNNSLVYDVQVLDSGSVSTLAAGDAEVTADVTRATA